MSEQEINNALGEFWGSTITDLRMDIKKLMMTLDIAIATKRCMSTHVIEFEQVSAFFFVNGDGDKRLITESWDNVELSEIYYNEHPQDHLQHHHDKVGTPKYYAECNFSLELWSALLLIEAKSVVIDGTRYAA
jgi:hypothetical protein